MSKFFIHRPIFAIVISIMIVMVGIISAFQLPIAQYPQISPPTVQVSTCYVGANSKVVNETVAQVIEQQVNGTQGMDYMSSTSNDTGQYSLQVVFELGTDGDMDTVKVQNNVAVANSVLPDAVKTFGVTTSKSSQTMAIMYAMTSPNGTYDRTFMMNYANIYLLDQIKRVNGVGGIQIFGAEYAMRLWLNPDKLAEYELTVPDVINAINEQNVQAPAGIVGSQPSPNGQEKQATGSIDGRLVTTEQFADIILKATPDGHYIRVGDVARVENGPKNYDIVGYHNSKPSIIFGVQLTDDANTMVAVSQVREIMDNAMKEFPPDLKAQSIVDSTKFIRASITEVVETFVEALLLVVLVVFIFLQSWRATLIPLLAVPVSLIGTFAAFIGLGFSINTLTLFAMVLAIGLVVDDAIVVIENVEHHMRADKMNAVDATERAMEEVQGPVVAIAFVLAAVFIPVAFLGGMMGVLYRQFALTIAVSMALSAFVALTLTPALCAMLLKEHDEKEEHQKKGLDLFFDKFNTGFNTMRLKYQSIIGWSIRHTKYAFLLIVIITGLTAFMYKIVPTTFVPDEDQGYYTVYMALPEGSSLNQTQKSADKLTAAIQEIPGVSDVLGITGFDILSFGAKSNTATLFVGVDTWDERTTNDLSLDSIIRKTFGAGAVACPEAMVIAFNIPALPGLGNVGGWTLGLQDLSGHTDAELDAISKQIVAAANQRPELLGVRTTYKVNSPIFKYDIDREKVKQLGIKLSDVFNTMQVNFGGAQINDFNQFGRTYKVVLQSDSIYRDDPEQMRFSFVKSNTGAMIPLDSLLVPNRNTAPALITRFNGARSLSIQGSVGQGYSSGQALAAIEEVVKANAPDGFAIEWSGQSRQEKKAASSTGTVLALALVFVFLCLAALYESWSVPFAVLLCVPIGIFGALFSEYITGMIQALDGFPNAGLQNSVYMQIGVIMLIGLAAKNAILIVEFAKVRVDSGMNPLKAAIEAAGLRLRPILMTSFAFIIGCLPLAVASGAGAAARNGMGVAVVGGMLFATVIGIFVIPSLYIMTEYVAGKLGMGKKAKKKDTSDYL